MAIGAKNSGRARLLAVAACGLSLTAPGHAQQVAPEPAELDPDAPMDAMPDLGVDWPAGRTIAPDLLIGEVDPDDYDALLLPGGVGNPDRLRMEPGAVALVRAYVDAGKPVAAICHGPWLLVEADVVRGRRVTSWPSIRTDLCNAGGLVVDEAAVTDGPIITSRNPDDVPAFTGALAKALLH